MSTPVTAVVSVFVSAAVGVYEALSESQADEETIQASQRGPQTA